MIATITRIRYSERNSVPCIASELEHPVREGLAQLEAGEVG